MSTITPADFAAWNARQPLAFALVDGLPVRLPEADQAPSRLARIRHVAARILPNDEAIRGWMATPQVLLGGQRPEAVASESEEGCQQVPRLLVTIERLRERVDD